jgi:HPt (histidine-containing phosphotransfer) domain-containing protein
MLSVDALRTAGVDVESGLSRCMGNEAFYLKMVKMALENDSYERMDAAVRAGDLKEGFERAHALKGILANVSLTTVLEPVKEITEELRVKKQMDYEPLLTRIAEEIAALRGLAE